jgi:hypothetical protein
LQVKELPDKLVKLIVNNVSTACPVINEWDVNELCDLF